MKLFKLIGMFIGLMLMLTIGMFFSYVLIQELSSPRAIPITILTLGALMGYIATWGMLVEIRNAIKEFL